MSQKLFVHWRWLGETLGLFVGGKGMGCFWKMQGNFRLEFKGNDIDGRFQR